MGKSLYRTHRSLSFDEIVGQDHIVTMLTNSIKNDQISHAYLLCGPRGTGKTSIARIMAHAVNDQNYDETASNMDIIEIDAASNRRIDEIREIRDQVNIAPTVGKYKIYIIDEVHMLTKEAFNALLKTLEEPPKHVIFILATTEFNKVPDTIISRCITLQFKPIDEKTLTDHLKNISDKEKIRIDHESLKLIAEHSGGSFRDAITILEQVRQISDKVTVEDVYFLLGLTPDETIKSIGSLLEIGDISKLSTYLTTIFKGNINITKLASQISDYYRTLLLENKTGRLTVKQILNLQKELLEVPASSNQRISLEIALFSLASQDQNPPSRKLVDLKAPVLKQETVLNVPSKTLPKTKQKTKSDIPDAVSSIDNSFKDLLSENKQNTIPNISVAQTNPEDKVWDLVLTKLKTANSTLYGIARMAEVYEVTGKITLECKFAFHQKQLKEPKNSNILSEIIGELASSPTSLEINLIKKPETPKEQLRSNSLKEDNISNIFGDHEVVES